MAAQMADSKAQKIINEALSRYPKDHKINNTNIKCARKFIEFVFADGHAPAEEAKKSFFRQLDSKALIALAVLIRIRDIHANSVATIEGLYKHSSFISTTAWYNNLGLWKASLGVVSYSAAYLRFRKDAVDAIQQAESPYQPTPALPTPALPTPALPTPALPTSAPFRDPDVEPGPTGEITCPFCSAKWLKRGVVACSPETASVVSGDPFKRRPSAICPPPPTTRSPPAPAASTDDPAPIDSADAAPADAAETPAQPSHTGGSHAHVLGKRQRLEDAPSAAFGVPSKSSDLSVAPPDPGLSQTPTSQHGNGYSIDSTASHPPAGLSSRDIFAAARSLFLPAQTPWIADPSI